MTPNDHNQNAAEKPADPKPQAPIRKNTPYIAIQRIIAGIRPGFILRKVGEAFMVMPTGPRMKEYQGMITLNETGAFLFKEAQKEGASKERFVEACIAEYGATPEEAEQAADAFMLQCAQCGLMAAETKYFDRRTGKEVTEDQMTEVLEDEPAE